MSQPELVQYLSTFVEQASVEAAIGGALALANRPDYTDLLGQIEVPTLVYVDVEDTAYPVAASRSMAEAIPNSTIVTISDVAHAAVFEAPERTNEEILTWASGLS